MELYIRSFKIISSFNDGREVTTKDEVAALEHLLETLLDDHGNVIEDLTQVNSETKIFEFVFYYLGIP